MTKLDPTRRDFAWSCSTVYALWDLARPSLAGGSGGLEDLGDVASGEDHRDYY